MVKARSLLEEQHQWYRSQPVTYRREWWVWAAEESNFMDMVRTFDEADPHVIRIRDLIVEQRGAK